MKKASFLVAAALATPAFAQNDACSGATPILANTPTAFDTTAATIDPADPAFTCAGGGGADIWFSYTTTLAGGLVEATTCDNATYDTAIEIFEGACGTATLLTCNDDDGNCTGFTSTATTTPLPAGTDVLIRVSGFAGAVGLGTLTVSELPDPCAGVVADAFEDNDDCGTAAALTTPSMNTGLTLTMADPDFYEVTIPAGESIFVDVFFVSAVGDIDVYIWDPTIACGTALNGEGGANGSLALGFSATDDESVTYANTTGAPLTVAVEVDLWDGSTGMCNDYDLNIDTMIDPCTIADAFEDNDDCASAPQMMDGANNALNVQAADKDFYAVSVANGDTLTLDILHIAADGDLDAYLWNPMVSCDSDIVGEGGDGSELALGFSGSDDEFLSYTNTTGATQDLILEVRIWGGDATQCNTYDLIIGGSANNGPGPLGTSYCMANANSAGTLGAISGFGQSSVAANDLTLTASDLPPNQFGIFIVSQTSGFVPNAGGTSNGNLCLGGQIGRLNDPGQILSTGANGMFSLAIDITQVPQGNGSVAIMAGETWFWQAWHRDGVGAGSNFTDGLETNWN